MIKSIISRLLDSPTPFRLVDGASALSQVKDNPPASPAAYVYSGRDRSEASERATGPVLQRSIADISVVIVQENLSSDQAGAEDIEELKDFVRSRLIGFVPVGADEAMEHVEGELQDAKGGVVWFEDVYSVARYIEET